MPVSRGSAERCRHDMIADDCAWCTRPEKTPAGSTPEPTLRELVGPVNGAAYGPTFGAMYPGVCESCGASIRPEQQICADRDSGGFVHTECKEQE